MKIIIDISEDTYHDAKAGAEDGIEEWEAMRAIANGIPIEECGDCVNREAVKALVDDLNDGSFEWASVFTKITKLPPVAPKQNTPVGKWVRGFGNTSCTCSECHGNGESNYRYCQWCGVKMGGDQNETD